MTDLPRLPAEWEPQAAVLLAWPHAGTDWAERLPAVEDSYTALVAAIARFEPVLLCVADAGIEQRARARLAAAGVADGRIRFLRVPYDDTWTRDTGPITLVGEPARLLDFHFTGWGGKFEAGRDDQLVEQLAASGLFAGARRERVDFALEGGGIDVDGQGTLLTTWRCLHERHPTKPREDIAALLMQQLGQERVLWLEHGYIEGDDTDAHVDTLARFAAPDAIVFQACEDPGDPHHAELSAMAAELAALRTRDGAPYRLFPLPWPQPVLDRGAAGERRLAASYANFLIVNGAVLMPAYGDPADARAAAVLAQAFPGRDIVQVPCRALIWQNGSLHCVTMQLPEGSGYVHQAH
jgi:agmatine/peptidylarginine deiminase